ncbi:HK97 family phage prohead protease [Bacteroides caecimuris]|uniref:HK97 family phage prohead protease n=1 Tax=Bacteroides caecimuris TaxID=1796613 RepID=UPI0025B1D818|nr:HK97 family phage prohead protease [Bacteroides caecimuris]
MAGIKFIVSDETINSNGFIVLTAGINTARFERNPIMLYMHERENGVIGRWENVHKQGVQLIAEAVFDEGVELGKKVKYQVENGFLRSASIGIENMIYEERDGVKTVTQCDLFEISIVDMPANENAVKLYAKGSKPITSLLQSDSDKNDKNTTGQTLRVRLIDILGLEEDATDNAIINAVKTLLKEPTNVEKEVGQAIKNGYISDNNRENFLAMAAGNIKSFRAYCSDRKRVQSVEIDILLKRNISKVLPQEQPTFRKIGERMGVEVLRSLIDSIPTPIKPSHILSAAKKDRSAWTLEDYRRFAPDELRDNPALYKRLIAEKSGYSHGVKDLDYYRRHEPEYLAAHPELYKQLIEKELLKQNKQWH